EVAKLDPAPVLAAAADHAAHAEPEREGHPRQSTALPREDEPESRMDDADARRPRGVRRRLPFPADVGEEPVPWRAVLGERRLAAVPVVADGGCRDEHARATLEAAERLAEETGTVDPAPANPLLDRAAPAARCDALPCQMHDGVHALERPRVEP